MNQAFQSLTERPLDIRFTGRARRSEYLLRTFVWFGIWLIAQPLIVALGEINEAAGIALMLCVTCTAILEVLAVTIRRLHDIGWSGAWAIIAFIPIVGWVIMLLLLLIDSNEGKNKYGAPVKEFGDAA